ncbi:histidine kinase [bacterium]|nr:histidine kinase [bacterium]
MALSFINNQSTNQLFKQAMDYYRRDSAERIADLTTTALEQMIEHGRTHVHDSPEDYDVVVQSLDKLLSQQILQRNIDRVYIIVEHADSILVISEGSQIYDFYLGEGTVVANLDSLYSTRALSYFSVNRDLLWESEQIISSLDGDNTFHVLVPFYDRGEVAGAAYMRITPDVSSFLSLLKSAYNQSGVLFTGLVLMGFMAMFLIYSYTARERDLVHQQLFDQRAKQLREQVAHQKESLFTKRIYHTHHKAEKVMGFIKEDLRGLSEPNLDETRNRVTKYANFVSRVIYDMKSYDPPLHVIRNPLFQTNINEVISFIVDNIFNRVYREGVTNAVNFKLDLAQDLPIVQVNEFVIWEIIEPLIQNAVDHNSDRKIELLLRTSIEPENHNLVIEISDNGRGFPEDLLEEDENGIKALFKESMSTKEGEENSGYGCYLAREISRRCGWQLEARNNSQGGACFIIRAGLG